KVGSWAKCIIFDSVEKLLETSRVVLGVINNGYENIISYSASDKEIDATGDEVKSHFTKEDLEQNPLFEPSWIDKLYRINENPYGLDHLTAKLFPKGNKTSNLKSLEKWAKKNLNTSWDYSIQLPTGEIASTIQSLTTLSFYQSLNRDCSHATFHKFLFNITGIEFRFKHLLPFMAVKNYEFLINF